MWLCLCSCGNTTKATRGNLKNGNIKSCGCLHKEVMSLTHKKYNVYDLKGLYGVGWTSNTNHEFYFDLDEFDKIKYYCWQENDQGYITAYDMYNTDSNTTIRQHRLIMNLEKYDNIVDHINLKRYDNIKANIRLATKQLNGINRPCNINNKTGYKGVCKVGNKYMSRINKDGKGIYLGIYNSAEEAYEVRQKSEKLLFGEFAYKGGSNE